MSDPTLSAPAAEPSPARPAVHCGDCGVLISARTRAAHTICFPAHRDPLLRAADPTRCTVLDGDQRCTGTIKARGWCNAHLQRWTKTGDPLTPRARREPGVPLDAVKRAARATADECVLVPCGRSRPSLTYRGRPMNAARAVWWEATGTDPGTRQVIVICGHGDDGCISIGHLSLDAPDPDERCQVCGDPPAPGNPLKAGKHLRYCYQWARRNDPTAPRCVTDGCGRAVLVRGSGLCSRCDQRRLRGEDPGVRPFNAVNAGRACAVSWCQNDATSRGWCVTCYSWQYRNPGADPTERRYLYDRTVADVLAMVEAIEPDPATGCRVSTGVFSQDSWGYPTAGAAGTVVRVTRLVVASTLGRPMRRATHACHTCDNPPCVEPTHLWEGTPAQNTGDRDAKGRTAHGARSGRSRLTEDDVRQIRRRFVTGTNQHDSNTAELAAEFGVKRQTIRDVVNRRTWRRVT